MTTIDWPTGATEVSDWADVGTADEFRSFDGPKWTLPGLRWGFGDNETDGFVTVYGTQLRDGTIYQLFGPPSLSRWRAETLCRVWMPTSRERA